MTSAHAEWGSAAAAREGERVSGDRQLVIEIPRGLLIAVVDGVGHGPDAAAAADAAIDSISRHADRSPVEVLERCHAEIGQTRGAVALIARFDSVSSQLTWAGVGLIRGVLIRARPAQQPRRELLLTRPGVIGRALIPLFDSRLEIDSGDTLVIASDGVHGAFVESAKPSDRPARIAEQILAAHRTFADDAMVLVVRFNVSRP